MVIALFAVLTAAMVPLALRGGRAEMAVVKSGGRVVAQLPLTSPRTLEVTGPLGVTRIEVQPGRARVAADPGPRQYCVRQGWLTRANAIAICAPNHISLALVGSDPAYDSISY
ncbi:MAG: NusG domain II-containing protein [Rhodocyclaceae bacterium]